VRGHGYIPTALLVVRLFSLHTVLVDPKFLSKCGTRYVTFAVCQISEKVFRAGYNNNNNNNNKITAKITNTTNTNTKQLNDCLYIKYYRQVILTILKLR